MTRPERVRKPLVKITPSMIERVLNGLAAGHTLTTICQGAAMPTPEAFILLSKRDDRFREAYRAARRAGAELRGDILLDQAAKVLECTTMPQVQAYKVCPPRSRAG